MVALIGKVDRGLQARREVEQLRFDFADCPGDRAFELVAGDARLQRCHRVDEIDDRWQYIADKIAAWDATGEVPGDG